MKHAAHSTSYLFLAAAALAIFSILPSAGAGTFTANYRGGTGVWEQDGTNWDTNAYPNNGHFVVIAGNRYPDDNPLYKVVIDNPLSCTLGTFVVVQSVSVASGSTLDLTNNVRLISNLPLTNSGIITLNSTGSGSQLVLGDGSSVADNGQIILSENGTNYFSAVSDGDTLTVGPDASIRGAGQLNFGSFGGTVHFLNFVNQGVMEGTLPGYPLTIGLNNSANANLTNTGTLRASGSGTLRVREFGPGTVFNSGGTFEAIDNGTVRIGNNITVSDGTLATSGNGTIHGDYPGGGGGTLSNVTNTGSVAIADQESLAIAGTFTNNGTVAVNSLGNGAILRITNGTSLAGTGVVSLSNNGSNYILGVTNGATFTIAAGATIQGAGTISPGFSGGSNMLKITNNGLIDANITGAGLGIRVDDGNNGPFTNTGTLRASNGGSLNLYTLAASGTVTNNGGTLEALAASAINGSAGVSLIQNSGTIDLQGGAMTFPLGVDLEGGAMIGSGTFTGPIRNNGGSVGPGHSAGKIIVEGNYTQGANGVLNMEIGGTAAATEYDQLQVSGTAALGGTLNVSLIDGFQPQVGEVFQLILPGTFSGAFSTINTTGFTGQVNYSSSGITITVTTVSGLLLNISTRLNVLTGDNVLIGGFIIDGTAAKQVIVRAIGPSLGNFGVPNPLADPTLELHASDGSVISNDNWKDTQQAEIEAIGFAPTNDLESAILATLEPGAYTAIVRGTNGGTGVGLVETYDLDQAAGSLANISTRGFVDTGDNVMIGGFILGGGDRGDSTVLIRGIGPTLSDFGVTAALADPTLELHDSSGAVLAMNDNWKDTQQTDIEALGLAPGKDLEAAILVSLPPGNYTAIVRGKLDTTGVGLVEVYHLQQP